jgi:carbonic anhydrase/acetyltransferase-like protein (isoleucine patch superfamily)
MPLKSLGETGRILPYKGVVPRIAADAFIAPTAVLIGDVEIGPETGVWFGCILRGDLNSIRVGARTNIQDGTIVHVDSREFRATIGDDVTVGHNAVIHACTLESGSFVGIGATVLDGAVVESGAMVAAGALVTPAKRVPAGELWAGSPARKLRDLDPGVFAEYAAIAPRYVELARTYREAE